MYGPGKKTVFTDNYVLLGYLCDLHGRLKYLQINTDQPGKY